MTRTQIQQLVVVLLLILFVGVFLLSKKAPEPGSGAVPTPAPDGTPAPAGQAEPLPAVAPAASPDLSIPRDVFLLPIALLQRLQQREQEAIDLAKANREKEELDKTTPVTAQQIGITDLELQGIFWNVSNPQAIINRRIVSVGDRIDSAEVEAITKEGVILSLNGQKFDLKPEPFRSSGDKKEGSPQSWSSNVNMR